MTSQDTPTSTPHLAETVRFEPTRQAGLDRLAQFAPRSSAHYAGQRNYDFGTNNRSSVSALSPWIRHRLITEREVLTQTLAERGAAGASKFIQEVFWRGYFKGWLEQHPSVWQSYQSGLSSAQSTLESTASRASEYREATTGSTGIACFDHWCQELRETGYLHNHARMWFASIWIFTLRLPWELGADFFLRHLIDGDPASNTLSWRWVGGLHTKGKTYLARPSNIAKYTDGRFDPDGQLSSTAEPLVEEQDHPLVPLAVVPPLPNGKALLLITPEDCSPETFMVDKPVEVLGVIGPAQSGQSGLAHSFKKGAVQDAEVRSGGTAGQTSSTPDWTAAIMNAAEAAGTDQVITSWAPVGPVAMQLEQTKEALQQAGIHLYYAQRQYDRLTWPHATKGFFKLKKKIPQILGDLGLSD